MHQTRKLLAPALAAVGLLALSACSADGGNADAAAEDYYAANTEIRVAGGHDAGSGFDFYMRAVASSIERVGEFSTIVENIPGGGGLIGDNEVFTSDPDGSTIGLLNFPGHVFAQLTDTPSVEYDFREWEYLGRVASGAPVILVAADSEYQTAEDLLAATDEVSFGIEGAGSDAYYGAALAAQTFGFPATNVTGYEGTSAILTAILRGEVDATFLSYGSALQSIESGEMKALMLFGDTELPDLPGVPLATEFADNEEDVETLTAFGNIYSLERVFVAPPGTPEDRVEYLRALLEDVFAEEDFQAEVADAGRVLDPMSGAEVADAVAAVAVASDTLRELLAGIE